MARHERADFDTDPDADARMVFDNGVMLSNWNQASLHELPNSKDS